MRSIPPKRPFIRRLPWRVLHVLSQAQPQLTQAQLHLRIDVHRALAKLRARDRAVIRHLAMHDGNLREVATAFGCSLHTAWRISVRARKQLRYLLHQYANSRF